MGIPAKCLTIITLAAMAQVAHGALRCGSALVSEGAWPIEVEESCGAPDYVAQYPTATVPGLGVVQTEEHWYYNPGPQRFIRRIIFRNGKLARVDNLGYGFHISDSQSGGHRISSGPLNPRARSIASAGNQAQFFDTVSIWLEKLPEVEHG
jgi:hypothetical protein